MDTIMYKSESTPNQDQGHRLGEKITIPFLSKPSSTEIPSPVAIANEYLNRINFEEIINSKVTWDDKRCNVSPGILAKAVVLSTFYEVRSPLYKVENRFEHADTEFIFGSGVISDDLNDDAIAACLDRIAAANTDQTFISLSLSAYTEFNLTASLLHADTTNFVAHGKFDMCDEEDYTGLKIARGHSKANRPDKKQVGVGTIVNQDGISLISQTLDGNKADSEWNSEAVVLLRTVLSKDILSQAIYIADCKLVTMPNIHLLCGKKAEKDGDEEIIPVQFVSLCPNNFFNKITEKLVEQAYLDNNWSDPISLNAKKYTQYRIQSYTRTLEGHELRFIVVETSSQQDCIDKKIEKEKATFEKDVDKLVKQIFDSEKDALKALKEFQFHHKKKLFTLETSVESKTVVKLKRGRRAKDQEPKVDSETTTWHIIAGGIDPHKENTEKFIREEMTFVLIANVAKERLTDKKVLFTYKGQPVVEIKFHLIKQPCLLPAIYLKTPERIDALVMLLNVSLLIRGLMQYQARENLESFEEAPRIGVGGRRFDRPTSENMIYLLRSFTIEYDGANRYFKGINNSKDAECLMTLLTLLNIDGKMLLEKSG